MKWNFNFCFHWEVSGFRFWFIIHSLHWEQLGRVFVESVPPWKFWGWPWPAGGWPHTLDWRDTSGPRGKWVNPVGLQLPATKPLWQVSQRGGGEAEAAWMTTEAKRPGAMQGNSCSTICFLCICPFSSAMLLSHLPMRKSNSKTVYRIWSSGIQITNFFILTKELISYFNQSRDDLWFNVISFYFSSPTCSFFFIMTQSKTAIRLLPRHFIFALKEMYVLEGVICMSHQIVLSKCVRCLAFLICVFFF